MKHVDAAMRNIAAELLVESVASGCGKEMSEVRR
jgi:hypothetical protein